MSIAFAPVPATPPTVPGDRRARAEQPDAPLAETQAGSAHLRAVITLAATGRIQDHLEGGRRITAQAQWGLLVALASVATQDGDIGVPDAIGKRWLYLTASDGAVRRVPATAKNLGLLAMLGERAARRALRGLQQQGLLAREECRGCPDRCRLVWSEIMGALQTFAPPVGRVDGDGHAAAEQRTAVQGTAVQRTAVQRAAGGEANRRPLAEVTAAAPGAHATQLDTQGEAPRDGAGGRPRGRSAAVTEPGAGPVAARSVAPSPARPRAPEQLTFGPDATPSAARVRTTTRTAADLDPATLSALERGVFDAIVTDPSLAPITANPAQLARDLVRTGPGVNAAFEVARAGAWLRANPTHRKKCGARFLTAWITKVQERLPVRPESRDRHDRAGGEVSPEDRARAVELAEAIGRTMNVASAVLDGTPVTAPMLAALEDAHRKRALHPQSAAVNAHPDDVARRILPDAVPPPPRWVANQRIGGPS